MTEGVFDCLALDQRSLTAAFALGSQGMNGLSRLKELGLDRGRIGFDEMEVGEAGRERHLTDMTSHRAFDPQGRDRPGRRRRYLQDGDNQAGGSPAPHGGYGSGPGERGLASRYHHTLKQGNVMWASGVSSYNWYYSDSVRTYVVRSPTPQQAEAYALLETAFARLETVQHPGINSSGVAKSAIQTVRDGGGDADGLEMNIHTMGVEMVELQHQPSEEGFPLEPNVCFCVFLLYKPGRDVFAIEHNYVVRH